MVSIRRIGAWLLLSATCLGVAYAAPITTIAERIEQQLHNEGRDRYDQEKDSGRKPVESIEFFGVGTGMTATRLDHRRGL